MRLSRANRAPASRFRDRRGAAATSRTEEHRIRDEHQLLRLSISVCTVRRVASTAALADFQELVLATSRHAPGGSHGQFSELMWSDSQTSDPFLNAVTPLTSVRAPGPAAIERALRACADTTSPFSWWFNGCLPPAAAAGFEVVEPATLMALAVPDEGLHPVANGLVNPGHDLTEFFTAASTGFEDNNLESSSLVRVFEPLVRAGTVVPLVVRDVGTVVGTLLLHLGDADPSRAGVYWVSTTPAFRGNGIASSLVRHAVWLAGTANRTHVVLQSSPMAEHLYRQLGFIFQGRMGVAQRGAA